MKMSKNRLVSLTIVGLKIGAIGYAIILTLIIISNLSLFNPNWPFGLFASFSPVLLVVFPVVIGGLFLSWRRAILALALLAVLAFYPVLTFDKFVKPSGQDCLDVDCISVVAANLRHNDDALRRLSRSEAKDADILIIVEFPYDATQEDLLRLFPMNGDAHVVLITDSNLRLGSRIAVLSRTPLVETKLHLEDFPISKVRHRGIVEFNYKTESGDEIKFVAVHPPPPKSRAVTSSRDAYLNAARQKISNMSNFVLIGDFNITPWESGFESLPGKRAGDPRWVRTWNARKLWQRITIDHALLGDDIGLVETNVLEDVGSDHFPLHIVIHHKDG
jgi:endonuclease/exonuclease/phosphatase (EEP) superfamily protein YafD